MRTWTCSLLGLLSLVTGTGCETVIASTVPDLEPWARSFHGTADSNVHGVTVASAPDGAMFVAGTFDDNVDLGGGNLVVDAGTAVLVAHLDPAGEHIWSGNTGSNDGVSCAAISTDGFLYLGGSYDGAINFGSGKMTGYKNGYLAVWNPLGKSTFTKALGGEAEDWVDDIATTPFSDMLFLVARAGDDADFGAGAPSATYSKKDAVVVAYSPSGKHLWELRIPNAANEKLSVASDRNGNAIVTGSSYSDIQLGSLSAEPGAFVAKISKTGSPEWLRSAVSELGLPRFNDVALGTDDRIFVSGAIYYSTATINGFSFGDPNGGSAFWIALSPEGNPLHVKELATADYYTVPEIAVAPEGDLLVGFTADSGIDLGGGLLGLGIQQNVILGRFTQDGEHIASMELTGNAAETLGDLTVDAAGNPVITGWFNGALELGDESFTAEGNRDMFVARLDL